MKVANCINLARCQLPAAVSQGSTKTYQMCFTTLVWWDCIGDPIRGLHWRLNPRIALVTQSKDCTPVFPLKRLICLLQWKFCSPTFPMHIAADADADAHFKSHGLSRFAFFLHSLPSSNQNIFPQSCRSSP